MCEPECLQLLHEYKALLQAMPIFKLPTVGPHPYIPESVGHQWPHRYYSALIPALCGQTQARISTLTGFLVWHKPKQAILSLRGMLGPTAHGMLLDRKCQKHQCIVAEQHSSALSLSLARVPGWECRRASSESDSPPAVDGLKLCK